MKPMKRKGRILLAFLLVLCIAFSNSNYVKADKAQTKRTIAIVYDNSGSMYKNYSTNVPLETWCQATYAVEVFASMINEGDTVLIYPMNRIEVSGKPYTMRNPLRITSAEQAKEFETVVSPHDPGQVDTPIESIDAAFEGLTAESGDEKWLIVLTDGAIFNDAKGNALPDTKKALEERLSRDANQVNVLYLGIGEGINPPDINGKYVTDSVVARDGADVPKVLTKMCNQIFGRDELNFSGNDVSFDVSLKQLFVFVQGENISDVTITDAGGASVGTAGTQYPLKYAEGGSANPEIPFSIDTSLQGVIATFSEIPSGSYSLRYSGNAASVGVYYEPDVDVILQLVDADGGVVTKEDELKPGDYKMAFGLVDNQTGLATNSALIGKQNYIIRYTLNGETREENFDKANTIDVQLKAGDSLTLDELTAEYLSGYRITKTGSDFGWPFSGIEVNNLPAGDLKVFVSGGQDRYRISDMMEAKPFEIQLEYDGNILSEEELHNANISFDITGGNLKISSVQEKNKVLMSLAYADPAAPETTEAGPYQIKVNAEYTAPDHDPAVAADIASFELENDVTGLSAKFGGLAGSYTILQFSNQEFVVDLRMGGENLTEEEWNNFFCELKMEDKKENQIPLSVEKDKAGSRLLVKAEEKVRTGKFTLTVSTWTKNQLGQDTTASDEKTIKIQLLPSWVVLLIILAALLALFGLLWFIFSRKVLPKRVEIRDTKYTVNGNKIGGAASWDYSKGGQKRSLTCRSPKASAYPLAKTSVRIDLEATDTLWKVMWSKIKKRDNLTARCVGASGSTGVVNSINISGVTYKWDPKQRKFIDPATKEEPASFTIGTGTLVSVAAKRDSDSMKFSYVIHFK